MTDFGPTNTNRAEDFNQDQSQFNKNQHFYSIYNHETKDTQFFLGDISSPGDLVGLNDLQK